jgi:glutamate formiminotransferase
LICCKIYISESRNKSALDKIDEAARRDPENVVVLSKFGDHIYNRVRYTLISYISTSKWIYSNQGNISKLSHEVSSPIKDVLKRMVDAAFDTLSLESHEGAHPSKDWHS